jgi:hypothetical protein
MGTSVLSRTPVRRFLFLVSTSVLLAAIYLLLLFFLLPRTSDWSYLSLASLPADSEDLLPLMLSFRPTPVDAKARRW